MQEVSEVTMQTPIEIALGVDKNGMTTARRLYNFFGLAQGQFARWAKTNIVDNEFATENEDFWRVDIDVEGNKTVDYRLTAHFAKSCHVKVMEQEQRKQENISQQSKKRQKKKL